MDRGEDPRLPRWGLAIALLLLVAASVSLARAATDHTISLIDFEATPSWPRHFLVSLGLALPFGLAGWIYARAHAAGVAVPRFGRLVPTAVLVQLAASVAIPLTSSDLFSNLIYGELVCRGHNPHVTPPAALGEGNPFFRLLARPSGSGGGGLTWQTNTSPYGPLTTLVEASSALAGSVVGALLVFKIELLVTAIASVLIAWGYARKHAVAPVQAFLVLGFSPLFAWEVSGQAHNDGLMVLCLLGFVWAATEERPWAALAALLLACSAKLAALPVLALYLVYVVRRARRQTLAMSLVAVASLFVSLRPYWPWDGPAAGLASSEKLNPTHQTRSFIALASWICDAVAPRAQPFVYWTGVALAAAILSLLGLRAVRRAREPASMLHEALVVLLAVCLVTPWGQPWYATWLLPFAIAERDPRWQRLVVVYNALSLAQYGLVLDPVTYVVVSSIPAFMMWRLVREEAAAPSPVVHFA